MRQKRTDTDRFYRWTKYKSS